MQWEQRKNHPKNKKDFFIDIQYDQDKLYIQDNEFISFSYYMHKVKTQRSSKTTILFAQKNKQQPNTIFINLESSSSVLTNDFGEGGQKNYSNQPPREYRDGQVQKTETSESQLSWKKSIS